MRRIRWRHEPWTSGRAAGPLTVRALVTDADAPGGIVLRDAPDPEPAAHEGRFAVQLAAHEGAAVTGVVGSPERGEGLEALGAAELSVGFPSGREFDLVLESVGGSSLAAALGSVAPRGVIVSFGNSSGEPTTFDASAFYRRNGARLHAFVLFPELERTKLGTRDLGFLAGLVATGRLSTEVGAVASWHDAD